MRPGGPHSLLLVLPLLPFNQRESAALQARMELLTPGVWSHTMVVFTLGRQAGDRTGTHTPAVAKGRRRAAAVAAGSLSLQVPRGEQQGPRGQGAGDPAAGEGGGLGAWHFSLIMYCRMEGEWRRREREAKDRWEMEEETRKASWEGSDGHMAAYGCSLSPTQAGSSQRARC